jgi:hypothetical protein
MSKDLRAMRIRRMALGAQVKTLRRSHTSMMHLIQHIPDERVAPVRCVWSVLSSGIGVFRSSSGG